MALGFGRVEIRGVGGGRADELDALLVGGGGFGEVPGLLELLRLVCC